MSERHCRYCIGQGMLPDGTKLPACPGLPPCPECERLYDELGSAKIIYNACRAEEVRLRGKVTQLEAALASLERQLAEAQAHVRNHHLEPCVSCAATESERDALKAELAEAKATVAHQARQEIAEIANGHTSHAAHPIFDALTVLQAFKGTLWKERDALQASLEQVAAAARSGLDLSMWAATIKWDHRERNTAAWLAGLKARIERVQTLAALYAGEEAQP